MIKYYSNALSQTECLFPEEMHHIFLEEILEIRISGFHLLCYSYREYIS